ncbi:LytTR family DNA-binding domain-containing protein [Maribacter sp. SA7]|uniref:LytR/AlgR family response regulator transcription factor n=1 Tax=Maribacter zhoushanensis TaxID=3030012 RepID=UPI0023EC02E0|nr:LytTR family DNA-binding domain-containing protein [Maribacter zhoushanensis]MDF4202807.1 LytTR family DNA-binding domain-containing protein [Maribacter zhoushanensis]
MNYTYTIIDSDAVSNLQLHAFLDEYDNFECINTTSNPSDGLNDILKYAPDIVFINLNNDYASVFLMITEMHQYLKELPIFIGIASTKNYAYDAIKNGFFDYWLQPFNEFEIRKSLLKLQKKIPKSKKPITLCLKSYNDFQYLNTNDILYLKADNNTTEFFMKDDTIINAYKTLKTFEKSLPENFMRIHQSYIVNTNYVSRINFGKSICTIKAVKENIPFSKSYRENMENLKAILSKNTLSSLN